MDLIEAIILGLIEGLTEYLPVSSTGHLLIAQRLMGIEQGAAANAFAICIQAGAIAAVLTLYWRRVVSVARGLVGRDAAGLSLARNVVVAFLPAAVLGYLFGERIESHLFGPWPIVVAWATGGVVILLVTWDKLGKPPRAGTPLEQLALRGALVIGLIQCVAMWPGVSRSLVTIVGGVLVGLSLPAAVEFSFLLGVVTLGAATGYKAVQHGGAIVDQYDMATLAAGFLAATLSAMLAVKWMVGYLNRHGLAIFGYYRLGIAAVVAFLLLRGWLA